MYVNKFLEQDIQTVASRIVYKWDDFEKAVLMNEWKSFRKCLKRKLQKGSVRCIPGGLKWPWNCASKKMGSNWEGYGPWGNRIYLCQPNFLDKLQDDYRVCTYILNVGNDILFYFK